MGICKLTARKKCVFCLNQAPCYEAVVALGLPLKLLIWQRIVCNHILALGVLGLTLAAPLPPILLFEISLGCAAIYKKRVLARKAPLEFILGLKGA